MNSLDRVLSPMDYPIIKIFLLLIAVAFLIYRFQLISLIISIFFPSKKRNNMDLNQKIEELILEDKKRETNPNRNEENIIAVPKFRSLRAVKDRNKISYYFINEGISIFEIKISALDNFSILISPVNSIKNNESGCIVFILHDTNFKDALRFKIIYNDVQSNLRETNLSYLILTNEIREVKEY